MKTKISLLSSVIFAAILFVSCTSTETSEMVFPGAEWEWMSDVTEYGWSEEGLQAARDLTDELHTSAVMVIHKGKVVDAWGDLDYKYRCHSIRKSFLSALYGIHIENGTISRDATIEDLGIDDNEGLSDLEKQATVQMILQARSGVYHPALFETAAMTAAKPERHSAAPGEQYHYNNWDFNVAGTIYEQETGEAIHQSFMDRIAMPIGMQDYVPEDGRYVTGDESRHAAYPFVMSTRDMARFGHLFLNDGLWDGERVLPEGWVEESTAIHSVLGDERGDRGGYGYMWWVEVDGQHFGSVDRVPEGTYTGRGARGHVLAVVPKLDLVFVHRTNTAVSGQRTTYDDIGRVFELVVDALETSN
jgi:CubicO group peptidase (beta-lactamase class C family)